jgi:hypothetical protein
MINGIAGKMCPYCQTRLTGSEPVQICAQCRIPHHEECWRENGGCTSFGCTGQPQTTTPGPYQGDSALPNESDSTHIEVTLDDLSTCSRCGSAVSVWDDVCRTCGTATNAPAVRDVSRPPPMQYSVQTCGYGNGYKSPAAACLLNLLLAGAGYFYLGQPGKGLVVMSLGIVAGCFSFCVGYLVAVVYAMVDCYETARRMNGYQTY